MTQLYQFSNASNWNLLWSTNLTAPSVGAAILKQYSSIPDFTMPLLISNPVVAVYITSETDPGKWRRGGYIKQKVQTGIADGGQVDSYLTQSFLQLRKINIVQLQEINGNFALEFSVPYWLRQVSISVWEYTGVIADTVEQKLDDLTTFISDCCDELKALSESQNLGLGEQIQLTINKLASSEVILNSLKTTIGENAEPNSLISQVNNLENNLNGITSKLDGLEVNLSQQQAQQLNNIVTDNTTQINRNIGNLANSLSDVLAGNADPDVLNNFNNQSNIGSELI